MCKSKGRAGGWKRFPCVARACTGSSCARSAAPERAAFPALHGPYGPWDARATQNPRPTDPSSGPAPALHATAPMHPFLAPLLVLAPQAASAPVPAPAPPRLMVLVAVDQMIPEQLERLGPYMDGGLGRLWREGRVHLEAALPYARTETGAGHATLGTGCLPRTHGVVGNSFWDRAEGRERYCVEDNAAGLVTDGGVEPNEGRRSPGTLLVPTLGMHLQALDPAARVVSVSAKDRAAIGMCGAAEGLALWWDKNRGGFVTSTTYADELPAAVAAWNAGWEARARGFVWDDTSPVERVGGDPSAWGTAPDDRPGERPFGGQGVTMPYTLPAEASAKTLANLCYATPLCDDFVAELAAQLAVSMGLGADGVTDLLAVSFSGCDVVGHANGPYSREVTDLLFRLDRSLGALLDELDERVGEGRWVLALTADHGVLPLPERLESQGFAARRISGKDNQAMRGALLERVNARLGVKVRLHNAPGGLRLDLARLAEAGVDAAEARRVVAEELRALRPRFPWVDDAYSLEELGELGPDQLGVRGLLWASFHPARTADVVVIDAPHALIGMEKGTSHGTPHRYDRRIPLLFYGAPFPAGRVGGAAGSHDVVPTLLGAAGLAVEATFDGRDLGSRR